MRRPDCTEVVYEIKLSSLAQNEEGAATTVFLKVAILSISSPLGCCPATLTLGAIHDCRRTHLVVLSSQRLTADTSHTQQRPRNEACAGSSERYL